jgi:hypothetical protein
MTPPKSRHSQTEDQALQALKKAVRNVVSEHRATGRRLAIWQDGKVKLISAKQAAKH